MSEDVPRGTKRARTKREAWTRREFVAGTLAAAASGAALATVNDSTSGAQPPWAGPARDDDDAALAAIRAADQPRDENASPLVAQEG